MYRSHSFCTLFSLFSIISLSVAQPYKRLNSAEIYQGIQKLNTLGSVLYLAAHPDDENTRLISYLSNEKHYRVGYLSLTRGDGGQNLVGNEKGDLLGLIRTQELLEARKIDGGEQFFSRAIDFGYSKTKEETYNIWNEKEVLSDAVWVIRTFKPDVVICRFPNSEMAGHGHHTASADIAEKAVNAAADPTQFPDQLKYTSIWKVKRLVFNTSYWFYQRRGMEFNGDSLPNVDVGVYNPLLGMSYSEMAADSRSQHKSQGFGSAKTQGSQMEYFEHVWGDRAQEDIMEGIPTTWEDRIQDGEDIGEKLEKILEDFDFTDPTSVVKQLLEVYRGIQQLPSGHYRDVKLGEIKSLILAAAGVWYEALAYNWNYVPGDQLPVTYRMVNRSGVDVKIQRIYPLFTDHTLNENDLPANVLIDLTDTLHIPESLPYSEPYWLRNKRQNIGLFEVKDPMMIGKAEAPPDLQISFVFNIMGETIEVDRPVMYKWTDPVLGEQYRPAIIVPAITLNPEADNLLFRDNQSKSISLEIRSNADNAIEGNIQPVLPRGWKAEPSLVPLTLAAGDIKTITISITPPSKPGEAEVKWIFAADKTYDRQTIGVDYDHITPQVLFPASTTGLVKLELQTNGNTIGYIRGAGDDVPLALEQMGYQVTFLDENSLSGDLSSYHAIVAGIRAYNTQPWLYNKHATLMNYVQNGGTFIVQYNTSRGDLNESAIGPYPFKISRDRVTVEEAPATLLDPKHPIFNTPNKIGKTDFENWVQERGLYFADEYDDHYSPLIAWNDPGEARTMGSLLVANYGKGAFIYTGISFFRQLPAGVPGAFRLFANMVSYSPQISNQ